MEGKTFDLRIKNKKAETKDSCSLVFEVPADHYFMMGDNRDNSTDSRFSAVGYVPFENFVGRAEIIFYSQEQGAAFWQFWKWPTSVRWSRLFNLVD